jgi:hypothetical protein
MTERDEEKTSLGELIPGSIWLADLLSRQNVSSFEASFSGGGDEGGLNDLLFRRRDGTIDDKGEVDAFLSSILLPDGSAHVPTAKDMFDDMLDAATEADGDYCNNEGGSLWAEFHVLPQGIVKSSVDFTPGSYEDDPDDEDDFDDQDEDLEP